MSLIEKRQLHNTLVALYDPPVRGKTPLDGAGNPRTSRVPAVDVEAKLGLGCTREPLPAPKPERVPAKEGWGAKK